MTYQPMDLDCSKWPHAEGFVRNSIEALHFIDVHNMLRLPIKHQGVHAGCNFAATHVLLAAATGISTKLYNPGTGQGHYGKAFEDALLDFYPWDDEKGAPLSDTDKKAIVETLWVEFRAVLTHHGGVPVTKQKSTDQWLPANHGYVVKIKRIVKQNGNGLAERKIEKLECSKTWPFIVMARTMVITDEKKVLNLERFYWGLRRLVERITRCDSRMKAAESYLQNKRALH